MRGSVCANVNTRIRAETTTHLQSRDMSVMSSDLTLLQRFRQMTTRDRHDIVFFLLYSVFLCNSDDTAQGEAFVRTFSVCVNEVVSVVFSHCYDRLRAAL